MKIEYNLKNISGKNKSLCVGDLIRYYGETKYKILESVEKLNSNKTTKGMVANILKKAMNNPMVDTVMNNVEELAKKNIFCFTIDAVNPILFDTGKDSCILVVDIGEEYFAAKAIYAMMKPGFRRMEYADYIKREKESWVKWFEKNLRDYTSCCIRKVLEE